jgi:transcriptional regulator NrdR family protein
MRCDCGGESTVLLTRTEGNEIRRRRKCKKCKIVWTTMEKRLESFPDRRITGGRRWPKEFTPSTS